MGSSVALFARDPATKAQGASRGCPGLLGKCSFGSWVDGTGGCFVTPSLSVVSSGNPKVLFSPRLRPDFKQHLLFGARSLDE